MPAAAAQPNRKQPVKPAHLFRIWLGIGFQSFGGGLSTLTLIQRAFVQQRGWLTDDQFVRINAISQIAPGINILSITIQIGDELGGAAGVAASLLGLLLTSVSITVAMTAAYAAVQRLPVVQAAFRGIIPATIGLGVVTVWSMLRALLRESAITGGRPEAAAGLLVVALSAILIALRTPVMAVLIAGGAVMSVTRWFSSRNNHESVLDDDMPALPAAQSTEAAERR